MKEKTFSIRNSINLPFAMIVMVGLVIMATVSVLFLTKSISAFYVDEITVRQKLFTDQIWQDVLSGADFEVYRKCKSFRVNRNVLKIKVLGINDTEICSFEKLGHGSARSHIIKTIVYYDREKTVKAGEVFVEYTFTSIDKIIRNFGIIVLATLLILLVLQYWVGNVISKSISKPIIWITEQFKKSEINNLSGIKDKKSRINEINRLYLGIGRLAGRTLKVQNKLIESEKMAAMGNVASQVAHDIRSPLTSLETVVTHLFLDIPEASRTLIRSAVQRIGDIANDLSAKKSKEANEYNNSLGDEKFVTSLVSALIESLVSEKRIEYRSKNSIEIVSTLGSSYGLFANINTLEIKRALSNIINNSVQAFDEDCHGKVLVLLNDNNESIQIVISDNGKGIPYKFIAKLGMRGETHGKKGGQGLGLYHAKTSIEKMNGSFKVKSEEGKGTEVILTLPKAIPPDWFVPEILFDSETCVVIVDDDDSIHKVWDSRLSLIKEKPKKIVHLSCSNDVNVFYGKEKSSYNKFLFLCDYEFLGDDKNGLDIIEENDIADNSILVTSRYEEKIVRDRCKKLGVKLLPKGLAGFVPIKLRDTIKKKYDAILIDDQYVVRNTWELVSKIQKKTMKSYAHPRDFFKEADKIERDTDVYIDSHLSDDLRGEVVAEDIKKLGFERIYLATGASSDEFSKNLSWITGIRDKACPFLDDQG